MVWASNNLLRDNSPSEEQTEPTPNIKNYPSAVKMFGSEYGNIPPRVGAHMWQKGDLSEIKLTSIGKVLRVNYL
jgi:hypothetical protein